MYRWIRNTHLLLGLGTGLVLVMYALSAVQMAHSRWFNMRPTVTRSTVTVPVESRGGPRDVARHLITSQGFKGDLAQIKQSDEGFKFRIVRPGTVYEVDYSRGSGVAAVRKHVATTFGVINRLHHMAGLNHEYWLHNVWGVFVLAASSGLILIALTGIYMWFKLHTERVAGSILLGMGLVYSFALLYLMRTA